MKLWTDNEITYSHHQIIWQQNILTWTDWLWTEQTIDKPFWWIVSNVKVYSVKCGICVGCVDVVMTFVSCIIFLVNKSYIYFLWIIFKQGNNTEWNWFTTGPV